MKHVVSLRKVGKFYQSYEDDAYVIHYLMGYTVKNGKVGFPVASIGKVQNKLEEYKVSYQILEHDEVVEKQDFKNNNKYDKCLKEGINSSNKKRNDDELMKKIKTLSDDKVNKIINYINEVMNEE